MLKYYVRTTEALKRLSADQDGVVSFEYLIVAACIIAVVSLAFGPGGPLQGALSAGLNAVSAALVAAGGKAKVKVTAAAGESDGLVVIQKNGTLTPCPVDQLRKADAEVKEVKDIDHKA